MISRRTISHLLAGLLGSLAMLGASAQGFPNKMVTVMVPYPAGGPSDAVARLVQVEYEKNLGQKMMVENLGGVSGALGVQKVLAAPADGYYQLLSTPMELVMAPLALSAVKFKPEEVRMASLMGRTSIGLAVRKDLPVNNLAEFLAWAKGKQVSYASVGQGSLYHIMGERFKTLTGLDMLACALQSGGADLHRPGRQQRGHGFRAGRRPHHWHGQGQPLQDHRHLLQRASPPTARSRTHQRAKRHVRFHL